MTIQVEHFPDPTSDHATHDTPTKAQVVEADSLTWTDTFYNGKKGIVAVFDTDPVEVSKHKMWYQLKMILLWLLILAVVLLSNGMDEDKEWTYALVCGFFIAVLAVKAYKDSQSNGNKDHHVAITTEGIQVDPNPFFSITIPFQTIHSCEISSSGEISLECNTKKRQIRELLGMSNPLCGVLRAHDCVNVVRAMKQRSYQTPDRNAPSSSMIRKSDDTNIPETRPISWKDPFYDGNDTIIAAFDRDHDSVRRCFLTQTLLPLSAILLMCIIMFWVLIPDPTLDIMLTGVYSMLLLLAAFTLYRKLGKLMGEDRHVAVTNEGIRFDIGVDYTVIYPYDRFETCQARPYNNMIARLVSPGLQRISFGGGQNAKNLMASFDRLHRTLVENVDGLNKMLIGIEQAQEFADLVMAMKRERAKATSSDAAAEDDIFKPLIV